jgi:Transglutaminase-like superfamily
MAAQGADLRIAQASPRSSTPAGGLAERALLIAEILSAYLGTQRALRRAPIAAVLAEIRTSPRIDREVQSDAPAEARHLASAVVRTLALLPGDTRCLARSLVLTRLLARRGIPATLVIGARTVPDFLAHAWVEHEGRAVLAPGDGSFGRLAEL